VSFVPLQFIVQECDEGVNPQPKDDSLTIFVRRWCPAKLEFGKFQEITLDRKLNNNNWEIKDHFQFFKRTKIMSLQRTAKSDVHYHRSATSQ